MKNNKAYIAHRRNAEKLIKFGLRFVYEHGGRVPQIRELPVKLCTINYHFGTYQRYIYLLKEQKPILRRFCRNCGKFLLGNYFFCNDSCRDDYSENHIELAIQDEIEKKEAELEKPKRELAPRCKKCKEKCKVYIHKGTDPKSYTILCKKDKELVKLEAKILRRK